MKHLKFVALLATICTLFSCKKETSITDPAHEKSPYRVLVIGHGDTTISTAMFARTETTGIVVVEDSRLRASLIGYTKLPDGRGQYTIEMTSKQACDVQLNWGWDALNIDQVTPVNNTLLGNETKTFTLIGEAKEGKIKVQANGTPGCGNSSTLIVEITAQILPIKLIDNIAKFDELTKKVSISFILPDPALADWIIIQKQNESHVWMQAALIAADPNVKEYNIKL